MLTLLNTETLTFAPTLLMLLFVRSLITKINAALDSVSGEQAVTFSRDMRIILRSILIVLFHVKLNQMGDLSRVHKHRCPETVAVTPMCGNSLIETSGRQNPTRIHEKKL